MRTTTMDPLCEKYYSTSPYAWCGNNPVNLVDPDGRVLLDPTTQALANKGKERAEAIIENLEYTLADLHNLALEQENVSSELRGQINDVSSQLRLMRESLNTINLMINDPYRMFVFVLSDNPKGYVAFDENGTYNVHGCDLANIMHEVCHIGQSYQANNNFGLDKHNILLNAGGITELGARYELEAYQTQFLFDSNSVPSSFFADKKPTYNAITIWTIASFKSGDTDNLFPYSWMARFSKN